MKSKNRKSNHPKSEPSVVLSDHVTKSHDLVSDYATVCSPECNGQEYFWVLLELHIRTHFAF